MIPPSANSVVILLFVNEGILYLIALFKKRKIFTPARPVLCGYASKKSLQDFPSGNGTIGMRKLFVNLPITVSFTTLALYRPFTL